MIQNNFKNLLVRGLNLLEIQFSLSVGALNLGNLLPFAGFYEGSACARHKHIGFPCDNPVDEIFGYGTNQHDLSISANGLKSYSSDASYHEMAQLGQSMYGNEVHYFNFRDVFKNKRAYGSYEIPTYNLSRIQISGNISIWRGNTDRIANQYDISNLVRKLIKKSKYVFTWRRLTKLNQIINLTN